MSKLLHCVVLVVLATSFAGCSDAQTSTACITPPMGWNSFDAYDSRITEKQFKDCVDWLADNLLEYGWQYAVVDFIWFHPNPGSIEVPNFRPGHANIKLDQNGRPMEILTMDAYCRLLPAIERFPSAVGGKGFKPLANYVHSKGMKFGIHIMRGIPRQAYFDKTPILGTSYTAFDIAEPWDTCNWNNHMYGVDPTKPGSQTYYDSLFKLYAEWEVDLIKADDTMYPPYHKGEIDMMHKALAKCGRPMVLSLSCGEAPLGMAGHVSASSNMWRISADFWDDWKDLRHNFDLLNAWTPFASPGHWPDADMIPIGRLSLGGRPKGPERDSLLSYEEQKTLMTLWCIARSPLMWGGDPLTSSQTSVALLQNHEVLAVNQQSANNRQCFSGNDKIGWIADDPVTGGKYLALFNTTDKGDNVTFIFEWEMMRDRYAIRDLWQLKDLGVFEKEFTAHLPSHGAGLYRLTKQH